MKLLTLQPELYQFNGCEEFAEFFEIKKGDLFFTSGDIFRKHFSFLPQDIISIKRSDYGPDEPTDVMVEAIAGDILESGCKRIIAIGGGSVLDIAKILAVFTGGTVDSLYENPSELKKRRELILVPTTCGTGSEVTNLSIINRTRLGTKMGLSSSEMFADAAALIPSLLEDLPFRIFATSSIDALVHAVESFLSPKATPFTKLLSEKAMRTILCGYREIRNSGKVKAKIDYPEYLLASMYAGLAFGTAGCAAVHALSYPLGGVYHVAHGESNYAMFSGVIEKYMTIKSGGQLGELMGYLAQILECDLSEVLPQLDDLLNDILEKRPLHEYGVTREDLETFTDTVMTKQGRLMANNYVPLTRADVLEIYQKLF